MSGECRDIAMRLRAASDTLAALADARGEVKVKYTGFAGHLIVSDSCRFHLRTEVGDYLVSTVGAYKVRDDDAEWSDVGSWRKFETFVFCLGGPCDCGNDCGERKPDDWTEIDTLAANDPATATENHEAMVAKYLDAAIRAEVSE